MPLFAISASTLFATIFTILCLLLLLLGCCYSSSSTITIVNEWGYTVWPAIASHTGTSSPLAITGFVLQPGESAVIAVPSDWSGRVWGRTICSEDSTGRFSCVTGDCGGASSTVECGGGNATPPVTVAEFTLNGTGGGGLNFFRVSLVYGYNLPMTVEPLGGRASYNCLVAGCKLDLNMACPVKLKVVTIGGEVVGCQSACRAFGDCNPNPYSQFFMSACPDAHVDDAYNDGNFSCPSSNYLITFNDAATATSTSLKEPSQPTAMDKTSGQSLSNIARVVVVIILTVLGGYVAYKVKISCSNGQCSGECGAGGGQMQPAQNLPPV